MKKEHGRSQSQPPKHLLSAPVTCHLFFPCRLSLVLGSYARLAPSTFLALCLAVISIFSRFNSSLLFIFTSSPLFNFINPTVRDHHLHRNQLRCGSLASPRSSLHCTTLLRPSIVVHCIVLPPQLSQQPAIQQSGGGPPPQSRTQNPHLRFLSGPGPRLTSNLNGSRSHLCAAMPTRASLS